MTAWLIASVFALTIFTGISIEPLIPFSLDARQAKEWLSLLFVSGFVAAALYRGQLQIKNKALLAFMVYLLFHIVNAPPFEIQYGAVNIANAWMYQPAFKILLFILFFGAVSCAQIDLDRLFKWLYWLALGTAAYCLLQALGLDQFYFVGSSDPQRNTTNANITGTLGNPTLCAAFLAMLLPVALHQKKWLGAAFMAGVVLFIRSDMASASLIAGIVVYFSILKLWNWRLVLVGLAVLTATAGAAFYPQIEARASGRAAEWRQVAQDIVRSPIEKRAYPLTGMGLGSHASFYVNIHKSIFKEAHCEPLQVIYELGIIGLGLLIASLWAVVRRASHPAIMAALAAIFINSLGSFPFQVEPLAFLTVLFLGIAAKSNNICAQAVCPK